MIELSNALQKIFSGAVNPFGKNGVLLIVKPITMRIKILLIAAVLPVLCPTLNAQVAGSVNGFQKISSTTGGFTGNLNNSNWFGYSAAAIGDIDNDGVTDFVAGVPHTNRQAQQASGAVFVIRMNANGTVKATQEISRTQGNLGVQLPANGYFGVGVGAIGDFNNDGINDIVVGTQNNTFYILMLDTNGTVKTKHTVAAGIIGGISIGWSFGQSFCDLGDIDNDGVRDIAVGEYMANRVWLLRMNANGTIKSHSIINNPSTSAYFGYSVINLGDIDNDSIIDLAISAINYNSDMGAVYIYRLNTSYTPKSYQLITNGQGGLPSGTLASNYRFGTSVAAAGDFNLDGIPDLFVGAIHHPDGGTNSGAVFLLCLDTNGTVKSHVKISKLSPNLTTIASGTRFGCAIAPLGDINNNGDIEVAIGAPYDSDGGTEKGAFYVVKMNKGSFLSFILQPDGNAGKDAYIHSLQAGSNGTYENYGNHPCIAAVTWYSGSATNKARSLFQFNLSSIPSNATIIEAKLSLYHNSGYPGIIGHSGLNESYIRRITSNWQENTVTWANQPPTTAQNQVILAHSSTNNQNYLNIDVKNLVQDHINFPASSFGFLMQLVTEIGDRSMKFCSSDHTTSTLRPKIEIIYTVSGSTVNATHIGCNGDCNGAASVTPYGGTPPYTFIWSNNTTGQTISNLCAGTYHVTVSSATGTTTNTVIINQPPPLNVQLSGNVSICQGQSTTLSASGSGGTPPHFYYWSHNLGMGSSKTVSPGATTTYVVYALDANGCNSTPDSITVTVTPNTQAYMSGPASSYCISDSGSYALTATPSGGTFTGNGISGTQFSPVLAGTGSHTLTYNVPTGCVAPAQMQITVHPLPQPAISGLASTYCNNSPSVILSATPAGGSFSGTGISGNQFSPISAGQGTHLITYSVTDTNGCYNSSNQSITVHNAPVANAGNPLTTQLGTSATLTGSASGGSGMYSYSWAPADSFYFPTVQSPTTKPLYTDNTFTLTVTDLLNQCQSTATTIVHVQGSVTATSTASPAISCPGGPVQLNVVAGGGTGTFIYSWASQPPGFSSTISNPIVNPSVSTTYTVTVSSGIAASATSVVVLVHPKTTASITGLPQQLCTNTPPIVLQASPAGGSFSGTGVSSGTFYPSVAGAGNHTIIHTLLDTNNCQVKDSSTVLIHTPPVVSFSGLPISICTGDVPYPLLGTPAGGSFTGNGVSGSIYVPSLASPGTHMVSYSYTDNNGCTSTAYIAVTLKPSPAAIAGSDLTIPCGGSGIQIGSTAQAGISYAWQPTTGLSNASASNPVANPPHSVTYVLTVTDLNNYCQARDTISIQISGTPAIQLSNDTIVCPGSMLSLQASGALQYQWSTGDTTPVILIQPYQSGTYQVQAYNNPQCYTLGSIHVGIFQTKNIQLGNDTFITQHESITFDAGPGFNQYLWSNNATTQSITLIGSNMNLGSHYVWVIASDSNSCINSDSLMLMVTVGMEQKSHHAAIRVIPNPFVDQIRIENLSSELITIQIFGMDGKLILEKKADGSDVPIELFLNHLGAGLYNLRIINSVDVQNYKIMKVR